MPRCLLSTPIDGLHYCDLLLTNLLGEGANAKVYKEKIGKQFYAVKVYSHSDGFDEEKINFMIFNPPVDLYLDDGKKKYPLYAWPLSIVKNIESGVFGADIGYVMPLIDKDNSKTLEYFYDHNLSKMLLSQTSKALSFRIEILKNLSQRISSLHALGHRFVDLKPPNIGVYEGTNIVSLLDCDGFEVNYPSAGKKFSSTMVSPDYIAPEVFTAKSGQKTIDLSQDNYALAVIIFQMLNYGIHPFQGIIKDPNILISTNDEAAALGLYPYAIETNAKIKPKPQSIHETFLPATRALFDRAFCSHRDRPTASEWADHFDSILRNKLLSRCETYPDDPSHIRFSDKPCPACMLSLSKASNITKNFSGMSSSIKSFDDIAASFQENSTNAPSSNQAPSKNQSSSTASLFGYYILVIGFFAFIVAQTDFFKQGQSDTSSTNISAYNRTIQDLCRSAFDTSTFDWRTVPSSEPDIKDAKNRGLAPINCAEVLGLPRATEQTRNANICRLALVPDRTRWESSAFPIFKPYLDEVSRRGLTVDDCRRELSLPPIAMKSNEIKKDINLSSLPVISICTYALVPNKSRWEQEIHFQTYVKEAARRGLSVDDCRKELSLPRLSTQSLASKNVTVISEKMGWEASYLSSQLSLDVTTHDKLGDRGIAYVSQFRSADMRLQPSQFIIFVQGRANKNGDKNCFFKSPEHYFDNVLKRSRVEIIARKDISSEFFHVLEVSAFGFRINGQLNLLHVRDFILMSKSNKSVLIHVGGRFDSLRDVDVFIEFFHNMRFLENVDPFMLNC